MKQILAFIFTLLSLNLQAQQEVEMADQLRADGKIYVVVAVLSIILLGVLLYLIRIDTKISKLEKESRGENQ
ncbi:CcmD family protein [Rhodocytophaga aerolata]|uniref:CcmD family protein n=1 Tax=Rhodocytophaga aerolata TaxID=455078 RepID=A0ABT8R0I1_9BACT|nr:CcmD family protein [Rhodocytophaga aerolata]MDO1445591.1 CcmD family protein [Rhodocytophaga aerolata]